MRYLFQDGQGKASKTATAFTITMILIWVRFMVSDVSFSVLGHPVSFGPLDPMLVGAMIAASGGVYGWRRQQDSAERSSVPQEDPERLAEELQRLANSGD